MAVGLGLQIGEVRLELHGLAWVDAYERLEAVLRRALGDHGVEIEHVGSTAVRGLTAKPILDVIVGATPGTDVDRIAGVLSSTGLVDRGWITGAADDRMLAIESAPGIRVAHVHVVARDGARWKEYLRFRDVLRADPAALVRYAKTKADAAARATDRAAYLRAKSEVIERTLAGR